METGLVLPVNHDMTTTTVDYIGETVPVFLADRGLA